MSIDEHQNNRLNILKYNCKSVNHTRMTLNIQWRDTPITAEHQLINVRATDRAFNEKLQRLPDRKSTKNTINIIDEGRLFSTFDTLWNKTSIDFPETRSRGIWWTDCLLWKSLRPFIFSSSSPLPLSPTPCGDERSFFIGGDEREIGLAQRVTNEIKIAGKCEIEVERLAFELWKMSEEIVKLWT